MNTPSVVAEITDLAHALDWSVTAHGVETANQLAYLRELGCDSAQGYYFSGPVAGEEVSALLSTDLRR